MGLEEVLWGWVTLWVLLWGWVTLWVQLWVQLWGWVTLWVRLWGWVPLWVLLWGCPTPAGLDVRSARAQRQHLRGHLPHPQLQGDL